MTGVTSIEREEAIAALCLEDCLNFCRMLRIIFIFCGQLPCCFQIYSYIYIHVYAKNFNANLLEHIQFKIKNGVEVLFQPIQCSHFFFFLFCSSSSNLFNLIKCQLFRARSQY